MKLVNRAIAVVRPRQPFIDWVNGLDGIGLKLTPELARLQSRALLIPEHESGGDGRRFIELNHVFIFEDELTVWSRDRQVWPVDRTLRRFDEWFDVEFHSMVFDMGGDEIVSERID